GGRGSGVEGGGGQEGPSMGREVAEPMGVRHARVAERVSRGPVTLQRGDVRAPRLHADRDHAASIEDRERAVNARGLTPLPRVARVRPMLARLVAAALVLLVTATAAADPPVEAAPALVAP